MKQIATPYVRLKILVVGPHKIGKSCLIKHFCEGRFVRKYLPTIGIDYGVREYKIQSRVVKVNFFDCSGAEEFREIRTEFYSETQGVVFCYNLNDKDGMAKLSQFYEEFDGAVQKGAASACCFLLGLNSDMQQNVQEADIQIFAGRLGCAKTFKCSALTGNGIEDAFKYVFEETYSKFYGTK